MKNKKSRKLEIHINKYISEISKEITSIIEEERKILLNASPGSGKTTFFANLCIKHLQEKRPGRIIFCSPFLIIQSQFKTTIEKKGLKVDLELNHTNKRKHINSKDRIITSTFKSLRKINSDLRKDDLIIIDEAHSLLFTYGAGKKREFFSKTVQVLFNTNAKVVLMTGTPYSGITKILNLFEIKVLKENKNATVNIQYTNERETMLALSFAQNCLKKFGKDSLNIIYIKSTRKCELIKDIIEKYLNVKAFVLTASKKSSQVYHELETNSIISEGITFLITTNVISTGTNILNDNIGKALMLNEYNPTEIKQFSKRFRKKLDIEIDVLNHKYGTSDEDMSNLRKEVNKERLHQRMFYELTLVNLLINTEKHQPFLEIDSAYHPDKVGSPRKLINDIITRMVIQEAYFADKIAQTYNSEEELANALNSYEDVISVTTKYYTEDYTNTNLGEKEIEDLKNQELENFIDDFIIHQELFLKTAYWYAKKNKITTLYYNLETYLLPEIETRLIGIHDIDKKLNEIFIHTRFIKEVLEPLLEIDEFFKDRGKSLQFIKEVNTNKRKPHLIAFHVMDLIKSMFSYDFEEIPSLPPELKLKSSVNKFLLQRDQELRLKLDLIKAIYDQIAWSEYINYNDLNDYLVRTFQREVPYKTEDILLQEISIDGNNMPIKFERNLLIGICNGLFYLHKKGKRETHPVTGNRLLTIRFQKELPNPETAINQTQKEERISILNESIVKRYDIPTRELGKRLNLNTTTRIFNNKKLYLHSITANSYYKILENSNNELEEVK